MKMVFWILPLVLTAQPAIARMQVSGSGSGQQSASQPATKSDSQPAAKSVSVMSMGKIEVIDFEAQRVRINGVSYAFDSATRFFDGSARRTQATRLKVGDWINFWIKSGSPQGAPSLEQIALLGKS